MTIKKRVCLIVGILLFLVAMLLPLFAVWQYTGFGLKKESFRLSATLFHCVLLGDFALFYAQWKICPDVWVFVRTWFSNHAWTIRFVLFYLVAVQSLLFFRLYTVSSRRFTRLHENIGICIKNQFVDSSEHEAIQQSIENLRNEIKRDKSKDKNYDHLVRPQPMKRW